MKKRRIIISGGHLTPALAVIEVLPKQKWAILFVGRQSSLEGEKIPSIESRIIPQKGIRFASIQTGRIQRRPTWQTLPSILKFPLGFLQSLYWVLKFKPDVFLSFGGYVAAPLALAAKICRVPIITHVQSIKPGLASRFIGLLSQKICVSWPETKKYFPPPKTILTGNPLRQKLLKPLKIKKRWPTLYITGGGQGSIWINQVVRQSFPHLKNYFIYHQCGAKDYLQMLDFKSQLSLNEQKRYQVKDWFNEEELKIIFSQADLVIGRSGANTVAELVALGKPSLFIPLPWAAGDEQTINAQKLVKIGLAKILPQEKLSPQTFVEAIKAMFSHLEDYQKAGSQAKKFSHPQAAKAIVAEIEKVLNS